jgi:D-alanyl-D-alanine carboxypeptidase/D-alanyl-D-alanine-endopeptidase (penicillin-binding protein 4)
LVVSACVAGTLVLGVGAVVGVRQGLAGGSVSDERSAVPTAVATATPSATPSARATSVDSGPTMQTTLAPVLAAVTDPVSSSSKKVAGRVAKAGKSGGKVSAAVVSADSGKRLYANNAATTMIPASTNKLLTTTAALELLGPQHRFETTVVATKTLPSASPSAPSAPKSPPSSSATPSSPSSSRSASSSASPWSGSIVLVGGGDPYLTDAKTNASDGQGSLEELAASTATKLKAAGVTTVRLGYNASLFTGPAWNPDWPDGYGDVVTPTSALWVNEGRVGGAIGPRVTDPAKIAAEKFAVRLKKQGIKVSKINETKISKNATRIAAVQSLTLQRIVEHLLMTSDNDAAEVILRQVAVASGHSGSIEAGVAAVRKTLAGLHAWVSSTHTYDGSGLARTNKVSAEALVTVLDLAASGDHPQLSPILTGLPVAGVEGSLHYRFGSDGATAGRGLVHAKTGTLHSVHSLAGYAYTPDHELLVFAFMVNGAKNDWTAVQWLDKVSAEVASCGCKR